MISISWYVSPGEIQKDGAKSSFNLYDQANKRIRWMPRQLEAMKDVVACEKLGGADKQALIRKCPNGETHPQGYPSLNT